MLMGRWRPCHFVPAKSRSSHSRYLRTLVRTAAGVAVTAPDLAISNHDTRWTGPVNLTVTSRARSETQNLAVYAFDTLELGRYVELNGGVRWEVQDAAFRNLPLAVVPPGTAPLTDLQQRVQRSTERLFSYRGGVVVHPVEAVSLYAGYGKAKTPSSQTVRLGCGVPTAIGAADPVLGLPVMTRLRETIRGCPDPLILPEAGHFVQEAGHVELTATIDRTVRAT